VSSKNGSVKNCTGKNGTGKNCPFSILGFEFEVWEHLKSAAIFA